MPYINLNGQLIEVTQEQYDIYTIGQTLNPGTASVPVTAAANVASGGNVLVTDSDTTPILTPNTSISIPGLTLPTTDATVVGQVTVESAPSEYTLPSEVTSGFYDNTPVVVPPTLDIIDEAGINTYAGQDSLTAEELDAIANSQGVAGEEGFITTDTYAGQDSLTAEELDAIANSQGVAGEEGFITTDTLAREPGSYTAAELDAIAAAQGVDAGDGTDTGITEQFLYDNEEASQTAAFTNQARQQQTIAAQRKQVNNAADWRVRLRLAPQSKYLYNAPAPGILAPLTITDGVIFPYTPSINTSYKANYSSYDLTHSNFRGYFYQNSYVDAINISATFTAQDTAEANYLLAVIHFFRSATKMFYGQDAERGSPPPLTYLSGLGEYQFNEHPCLIQNFTYNLPADVDYIRSGSVTNSGTNLTTNRDRQSVATQGVFGSLNRLAAAFLTKGAIPGVRAPGLLQINNPTYVPTKMEIQITLLPIQSRQQVSKQFSVKNFANGNLLKGGFW
jgi:hypothetical protein